MPNETVTERAPDTKARWKGALLVTLSLALGACATQPEPAARAPSGPDDGTRQVSAMGGRVRTQTMSASSRELRGHKPARLNRAHARPTKPGAEPTGGGGEPAIPSVEDGFAEAFVRAHNQVRLGVPNAGKPLPPLRWSPKLAAQAQRWADRCEFEHSDVGYGENLAARSGGGSPESVTASWASEAADYDHRRHQCAAGAVCGHYTQMVWRASTELGCAVSTCGTNSPFGGGTWELWVCNYDPPGNWVGQAPY
ncbi:SCP-like family protein [Plesiocystis pacifica SIR-1]|uniref:SCP-like family protein n=1 Tax=Plesiocystis pacifica SIR-1 TaxID=391625 RepID=A6GHE6_9BACT|nr:SCP-like family protein [Plesiocystis pacifica SIR-1]